jgi:hypothetical protein
MPQGLSRYSAVKNVTLRFISETAKEKWEKLSLLPFSSILYSSLVLYPIFNFNISDVFEVLNILSVTITI